MKSHYIRVLIISIIITLIPSYIFMEKISVFNYLLIYLLITILDTLGFFDK
jgi:hypothetical protein